MNELLSAAVGSLATVIVAFITKLIDHGFSYFGSTDDMNEAVKVYSERIKEQHYPPFLEASLISTARRDIRHYKNKSDVIKLAIEQMKEDADSYSEENINKLHDDWLEMFFDTCSKFSDISVQTVLSKILTSELRTPDSIPRTLLHCLSKLEPYHIDAFSTLCKHTIFIDESILPIYDARDDSGYWRELDISANTLFQLDEVGLIRYDMNGLLIELQESSSFIIGNYHISNIHNCHETPVGDVLFTKAGEALFNVLDLSPDEASINHLIDFFKRIGCTIT